MADNTPKIYLLDHRENRYPPPLVLNIAST